MEKGSSSARLTAKTILVVDDEMASAELTATLLRSQGYDVLIMNDGQKALGLIARGEVDLLVVDLMMAKLDGAEVCAHIRHELAEPYFPVIITTSLHDRESRIRAKEAGADDILVKPVDGLELLVRIESLLRAYAAVSDRDRETERVRDELHTMRTQLTGHQRMVRAVEGTSVEMTALLLRQRRELDLMRRRWSHVPEVRDYVQRLVDTTEELQSCVDSLDGTRTVLRMPETGDGANVLDGRSAFVRVTK